MSNLQNHLQKETENMRLTSAEKSAMRARLEAAMAGVSSVPTHVPTKSPYQWIFAPRSFVLAAVAFLLVVSTGTSYAAEGSLPGGVLYPVKTNILEPLTVALASTPAAKAEANASIATTRVQEAQALAAHGDLTPAVAQEISDNYNVHATAALALAADADAATATTDATSTTNTDTVDTTNTTSAAPTDAPVPAVAVSASVPVPEATTTSDDIVLPPDAGTNAKISTFSARVTIAAAPTSTPEEVAPDAATSSPAVAPIMPPASSSVEGSLSSKLHASLSIQAKILNKLNAQVHFREGSNDTTATSTSDYGHKK